MIPYPLKRAVMLNLNPYWLSWTSKTEMQEDKHSCTHSASSCAISASSCSLFLSSSATSSAGLTLALSDTWSCEVQNRQPRYWHTGGTTYRISVFVFTLGRTGSTYRWFEVWVNFLKLWEWSSRERREGQDCWRLRIERLFYLIRKYEMNKIFFEAAQT